MTATATAIAVQPTDIPGCSLWLDAADASTVSAPAGAIASITDKVGSQVFAYAGATHPTYVSNVQNGLSATYHHY